LPFVSYDMVFDVRAQGAIKGALLVILFVWLDAREHHLRAAMLARWSNNRVWPVVVICIGAPLHAPPGGVF
jgi:hypothetical protein